MKKVTESIKVRYQETDQMGVVYHANYLVWFELGRTAFIEALGFTYADLEKSAVLSPVTHVSIDYHQPARYGTDCIVTTWVKAYNGLKTTYAYEIKDSNGVCLVTGETDHVIVKAETFKPISMRRSFPEWHQAYIKAMES